MNGQCDVCGQQAAFRIRSVDKGFRKIREYCEQHYQEITSGTGRLHSPLDSVFDSDFLSSFLEDPELGGRSSTGAGRSSLSGDREAVDIDAFLSEESRQALQRAAEAAAERGRDRIETEHLLFVLLGSPSVQHVLRRHKLSPEDLRQYLAETVPGWDERGDLPSRQVSIALSPRIKGVLRHALAASREMGHSYVGPEHLFIGLLEVGDGRAHDVLISYGLTGPALRQKTLKVLGGGEAGAKPQSETPQLDKYSRDLTQLARQGDLDPVIGRAQEIGTTIEILARRTKNNPVLIGEPGVGKTAIVEGLAQRIVNDEIPEVLRDKRVVEININSIVAGSKYRGEFEERIKQVVEEITNNREDLVVFVDELHTIMGAGQAGGDGGLDVANVLKPALGRGDLHMIGATTLSEYQRHIEKDAALERRFQPVFVAEPTVDQTVNILTGLRDRYEAHHRVKILDEAILSAAELSDRYIAGRFLPDKAIDLIDQAAARIRIEATSRPSVLQELQGEIKRIRRERDVAVSRREIERVRLLETELRRREQSLEKRTREWRSRLGDVLPEVKAAHIADIISSLTGIPVTDLTEEERNRLLRLEEKLHERVIGQEEAIRAVSEAVRLARAGLKPERQPVATFLFLGPSGVGKTELGKALAWTVFGDEDAMIRIDMSEYMEKHAVSRLVGAPPGYVGYEEGGQLTERVRRRPYSVILLDEIEKAHSDVHNVLLQLFDDGRLTDGKGRIVDFSNAIIIATSNIGSRRIQQNLSKEASRRVGYDALKHQLIEDLRNYFRPEFLNRIDEVIVFHSLTFENLKDIVRLQLERVRRTAHAQDLTLEFADSLVDYLARVGHRPEFGARELRRQVRARVETALAAELLQQRFGRGDRVRMSYEAGVDRVRMETLNRPDGEREKQTDQVAKAS